MFVMKHNEVALNYISDEELLKVYDSLYFDVGEQNEEKAKYWKAVRQVILSRLSRKDKKVSDENA